MASRLLELYSRLPAEALLAVELEVAHAVDHRPPVRDRPRREPLSIPDRPQFFCCDCSLPLPRTGIDLNVRRTRFACV
eukprot:3932043-Rhodomonas_salina.1